MAHWLQLFLGSRCGPVLNSTNLLWVRADDALRNNETQKGFLGFIVSFKVSEIHIFSLKVYLIFQKSL